MQAVQILLLATTLQDEVRQCYFAAGGFEGSALLFFVTVMRKPDVNGSKAQEICQQKGVVGDNVEVVVDVSARKAGGLKL